MIRITVFAGPPEDKSHSSATTTVKIVAEHDVSEELRILGTEWRTADYFPNRQTVITLDPIPDASNRAQVVANVRRAAGLLEETGLL